MLVILSGSSGSGKDTIKKELMKMSENITTIPSITSRQPRKGEVEGNPYIFVSKEEFEEMIEKGEFYEYNYHHNNYYGTSKTVINNKLKEGKIIVKDIDVNGTENLVNLLGNQTKIVTIFLKVSKDVLRERLEKRGDTEDAITLRLARFDLEAEKQSNYDYIIPNNNLQKTSDIIMTIIESENKLN